MGKKAVGPLADPYGVPEAVEDWATDTVFEFAWLSCFVDAAHEFSTGRSSFMYLNALLEHVCVKVLITPSPLYQHPRVGPH